MKTRHYIYILGVLALLGMASCSSSRKAAVEPAAFVSAWKTGESVVSKSTLRLSAPGGKSVNVSATLRMRRDDVIQINATYFLGIQIGTAELTRDSILVVSRITRQYAVLGYPELSVLLGRSVTFKDIQDIFWGEAGDFKVRGIDWKYISFANTADGRRLPKELEVSLSRGAASYGMYMSMSDYRFEEGWASRTSVSTSSYSSLQIEQVVTLLKMLMGE